MRKIIYSTSMYSGSQGEWPGCACVNYDDFTVLVSGGGGCHWVSMCIMWPLHSKWASNSNESASNFALSLSIPPLKLFRWFRRPQLWAPGDWQLYQDNTSAHASHPQAEFFCETSNHPGDSAPLQTSFGALRLLPFPKTKITFEREISGPQWHSGRYVGAAHGDWEWRQSLPCFCQSFRNHELSLNSNPSLLHTYWLNLNSLI